MHLAGDREFVKLRISGSAFRSRPRRRRAVVERKLEMESRPISALGPALQQLKERNFTRKKIR